VTCCHEIIEPFCNEREKTSSAVNLNHRPVPRLSPQARAPAETADTLCMEGVRAAFLLFINNDLARLRALGGHAYGLSS
jgi:hypothetical protein